ncbi:hypothetical protein CEQ90_14030 [Lewinellaceae bacterium SD302]|nr:hypothetical protein CEQ90_14030 [Lewinellaceae bacterium SD302]
MRNFTLLFLLLASFTLSAQTEHMVSVTSNVFTPEVLTIEVGDMVTWTNTQGAHNVNGTQNDFPDNPESFGNDVGVNWTYSFTFTQPGTYDYQCDPHQFLGMVGQVIVEAAGANNTIVINEINYNSPESGSDSLEFVELFNFGGDDIDLTGWSFTQGFEHTFGDVSLGAGEYLIMAVNAEAFINTYNYGGDVIQWTGGALSNGGEDIELTNADGVVIDYVDYDNALPWPAEANGDGPTLVLCDPESDNSVPAAWQAASTSTGFSINGIEVFANPGAASDCGDPVQLVYWNSNSMSVNEDDGSVTFDVVVQGLANSGAEIAINLGAATTATEGADFEQNGGGVFPVFFNNIDSDLQTFTVSIDIVDDVDEEGNEIIELALTTTVGEVAGDSLREITIVDNDVDVVVSDIDDINDIDADGVALFADSIRTVQGVVSCLDYDGNEGYGFFLIEPATGDGIYVFSGGDVSDYQLTEGDEIRVTGELVQFRGLLEIVPSLINVISTDNDPLTPESVTTLDESTESRYVELSLSPLTPTEDFITVFGSGAINATAVTLEGDTVTIRIDETTGIDSAFVAAFFADNAAQGTFITGYGSQFAGFDPPFVGGYQILPCSEDDFDTSVNTNEPIWATDLKIYPNPVTSLLTADVPVIAEQFRLVDGLGRSVRTGLIRTDKLQLDLSQLNSGVYYLQLFSAGEVVTRPIVKQ